MLQIRGVEVDHSTIQRWVFKFSPAIEKNMHCRKFQVGNSWRMDEIYIKVGGKYRFLYRAVDKEENTVDFLLTKRRQKMSAQKFFNKGIGNNGRPRTVNIDKSGTIKIVVWVINRRAILVKKTKRFGDCINIHKPLR